MNLNPDQKLGAHDAVVRLLEYIEGDGIIREGLADTPDRVLKAYAEWFSGYSVDPVSVVKAFRDGAEGVHSDEMVVQVGIPFYSHCEHHMAPIFGHVHIGYIPAGRILGLSKFKRLTDIFARRLQVQERLTTQIADALHEALEPLGVAVVIEARHMCMESRGVNTPGTITKTTALRGVFKEQLAAREEFLNHVARG